MSRGLFTSMETSRITGVSVRQLQYWDKTGMVYPGARRSRGKGSPRLYSRYDVFQLKVIRRLLDAGMSMQHIRKNWGFMRKLLEGHYPTVELVLVSDGHSIYAYRDGDAMLHALPDEQQALHLSLGQVMQEMEEQIDPLSNESIPGSRKAE